MNPEETFANLQERVLNGRANRREVLKRGAILGLSAPAIAALLAACGGDDTAATNTPATGAATQPPAAETTAAPEATSPPTDATTAPADATSAPTESAPAAEATTATGAGEATEGKGRGLGDTLRLLIWQAPTMLNPHFSQGDKDSIAARIVMEPLANIMSDGTLQACLAAEIPSLENGGVAADGLSVTWKLRDDVLWSDGEPFTAEDVVFTWQYSSDPATASTTFGTYSVIDDIEVIDEHTVTLKFAEPNPGWYTIFTGTFNGTVLPKHILQDYMGAEARNAPFNLLPTGTGPYKVVDFRPGDTAIYEINENYRVPDKPYFSRIELQGGGDPTMAARAVLQSGETDYAWNLQIEKTVAEQFRADATTGELVATVGNGAEQLLLNFADPNTEVDGARSEPSTTHPYLSDKNVRLALGLASDREAIATQLYGDGNNPTANTLAGPAAMVSPNNPVVFDLDAAAQLLDDAGWTGTPRAKDGVTLNVVYATTINAVRQKTQEILKQDWEKIGFSVELRAIDAGVFFSSDAGNPDTRAHFYWDVQMFSNGPASPFPLDYMHAFTSIDPARDIAQQANQWSGDNTQRWVNEEFNTLYTQASTELDRDKSIELFIKMNDIVVQDGARVGLVHRGGLTGFSNRVKGYTLSAWETVLFSVADWYAEE